MEASSKSPSPLSTLTTFLALYLTTLFSFDTFSAARSSPFRAPSSTFHTRPATTAPSEYQAGMHGRGNAGPGSGESRRTRRGEVRDTRPPIGMGASAGCGACMT